jgi:hypothetical protein
MLVNSDKSATQKLHDLWGEGGRRPNEGENWLSACHVPSTKAPLRCPSNSRPRKRGQECDRQAFASEPIQTLLRGRACAMG